MKILIFGKTGMLGHTLFRSLSLQTDFVVYATMRTRTSKCAEANGKSGKVFIDVDVNNYDSLIRTFATVKPDIAINCIGMTKNQEILNNTIVGAEVNALLPHRLALLCQTTNTRLIHISTDSVFDGVRGMYNEKDGVNVSDVYGMTKYLGEVNLPNCLTLRTSIIGHELRGKSGLIEWFLAQDTKIRGFSKAIYTGFPTIELARIINDYILPNENLSGLYHLSSDPISKYELLCLVARQYGKKIDIEPDDSIIIDRSLDSTAFRSATGYIPPAWPELIDNMYLDYIENKGSLYV